MKILTWNINGIRAARRDKSLKNILDSLEADVICLQETKVTRDMLDEVTAIVDGYNAYFSFSKVKTGYSGVATFCRDAVTPVAAEEGLSSTLTQQPSIGCYSNISDFSVEELEALDAEGRTLLTEHRLLDGKSVVIINVYCPRADKENKDRVNFKLNFYRLLQERAEMLLRAGRHVIILGDINTAHKMIDHCEPDEEETFNANPGRQWLNQFLFSRERSNKPCTSLTEDPSKSQQEKEKMFVDTFRYFHPTERGAFTNWCTVTSARQTNYGTRIDYILADAELVEKEFVDCVIRADVEGSDHCPVVATLKTSFQGALKPPTLCTKYMPEFAGKQQKLNYYFVKNSEHPRSSSQPTVSSVSNKSHEVTTSLKRSASFGDDKGSVKRQKLGTKPKLSSQPKTDLFNFFSRSSNSVSNSSDGKVKGKTVIGNPENLKVSETMTSHANKESSSLKLDECSSREQTSSRRDEDKLSDDAMTNKDCPKKRKAEVALWKNILTGPRPPPLCSGHKEPCVLRTVKVKGPNQGKQFYCCARPQGHSSNPQARCNFFKWVK